MIPSLLPQLTAQAQLNFLPDRQGAPLLRLSGAGQTKPSFSPVFARALSDPALTDHDGEGSTQAGAVHGQHFAEPSLRHLPGTREHLQDGELRGPQLKGTERFLVELGKCAGGPAEAPTHTRQRR